MPRWCLTHPTRIGDDQAVNGWNAGKSLARSQPSVYTIAEDLGMSAPARGLETMSGRLSNRQALLFVELVVY